jgi:hydroxyacylglutathione hydrolase
MGSFMHLAALPAFTDNYIWMIHDGAHALVVDPGDAQVVNAALERHSLQLVTILLTHHHADHTGGVDELRQATGCEVVGPAGEPMPEPLRRVAGGDSVQALGHTFSVMDVPGHTAGHIAYYCEAFEGSPLVFCGDTLFSGGCGRLFEGTPAQMLASLDSLAALPAHTRVCCTHEYTLANLRFARAVEPDNAALADYEARCIALRAGGLPTLPSSIALEKQINPFLRSRETSLQKAAQSYHPDASTPVQCFAALREWKNNFR